MFWKSERLKVGHSIFGSKLHIQTRLSSVSICLAENLAGDHASRVPFYQAFVKPKQNLHLIRADSHSEKTLKEVQKIFQKEPLDFLFIDGDHSYEGVKRDFELYSPLVKEGGLIGLHDILPRQDLPNIQVERFWKEIKDQYKSREIIGAEGTGRTFGYGLVHK